MFEQRAITSISILILVIFLGYFLRKFKTLKEDHAKLFANLILKITLPALIFSALSQSNLSSENIMLAVVMIASQGACALIAYGAGSLLKLSGPKKGGLILASTFPSSAFLGYAIVREIYQNNPGAIADAVIISELGVALPLFTFGIFIAMHFGNTNKSGSEIRREILHFLYSPIFISIVLGILFSWVRIPQKNTFISGFYETLHLISSANSFLVAMCIGVMLKFRGITKYALILLIAIVIKLIMQPLFSYGQALLLDFNETWQRISVLEAAMPTAAMTAVFAKKYGDDADLTSVLVFATFLSSCLTMFMMLILLG
ncbi:MAG: AEC family transporter [Bacteroidales bacterium]|nr:AEC family transporter [Bacteroidales bacterium]MCF8388214.1 AEC family transporter [Bacteroidales bacterium]MCF8399615.1 AEC family transporter [Bacteroidales bacterium]